MGRHRREADLKDEYDGYRKRLVDNYQLAYEGTGFSALENHYRELKSLYSHVKNDSNLTLHFADAQALNDTATFAAVNAKNMHFNDSEAFLNTAEFVGRAKSFLQADTFTKTEEEEDFADHTEEQFNSYSWLKLGLLYVKTSKRPIPMEFLNGPLYAEKKVVVRSKVVDDTRGLERTTAQNIEANDIQSDTHGTAALVKSTYAMIKRKQAQNKQPVNFFRFFINPKSFSQSVENLFFTSFLIKDGRLKLYKDKNGIPMIQELEEDFREQHARDKASNSHHIASIDYDTWEGLIKTYNITECYLGHRDVEEDNWNPQDDVEEEEEEEEEDAADADVLLGEEFDQIEGIEHDSSDTAGKDDGI